MKVWQVLLIILVILIAVLVVLYFLGKRAQKKQEENQAQIEAAKQTVNMLIIDKKRLRIKESGLPQMVIDQTPKLMRRTKLPIVKAKIGPRIMTMVADFRSDPIEKRSESYNQWYLYHRCPRCQRSSGTAKTEGKVLPENEKQNRKKRQIKLKNGAYFPVMDDKLRFLLHCISINNWSGGPILIML